MKIDQVALPISLPFNVLFLISRLNTIGNLIPLEAEGKLAGDKWVRVIKIHLMNV